MIALFIKEVRQLFPILFLWFALLVMTYLSLLTSRRPDELTFATWCGEVCSVGLNADVISNAIFLMILLLVTAYSLYPREYDESTIDFLNALPVSRVTIFIAKCLAGWLSLSVMIGLSYLFDFGLLSLNTQSLDGGNYPDVLATFLIRDSLFTFVVIGHGVFLSRFRTPGLLVYALYLLGLLWWENSVGRAGSLSIFSFYRNEFVGSSLVLNWTAIGWHVLVAALLYLWAGYLWTRAETSVVSNGGRNRSRWVGIAVAVCAFVVLSGAVAGRFFVEDAMQQRTVFSTEYFDFVALSDSESIVSGLSENADEDYESLQQLLATDLEPHIVADLTASKGHVGGLAVWKKIQMDISDGQSGRHYRRVLSHESAHVFQSVIADRVFARNSNVSHFFLEGMAQVVSFRLVPQPRIRDANWLVAAMAYQRQDIRFEELANFALLREQYDPELVYSLADTWVEALIRTCDLAVLGNVLRTAGERRLPDGLPAERFWRELLQPSDCELEQVNLEWHRAMNELLPEGEDLYPQFGQHQFSRLAASRGVSVDVKLTPAADGRTPIDVDQFYIRLASEQTLVAGTGRVFRGDSSQVDGENRVTFILPANAVNDDRVRYQLGFRPVAEARIFFEEWQSSVISDPADDAVRRSSEN
ncbi:MAG: ABC transporter permease [Gammaproteobacteria bacterium]|nr:ABC transporter permease [Gammaproteobacteria bacterium]